MRCRRMHAGQASRDLTGSDCDGMGRHPCGGCPCGSGYPGGNTHEDFPNPFGEDNKGKNTAIVDLSKASADHDAAARPYVRRRASSSPLHLLHAQLCINLLLILVQFLIKMAAVPCLVIASSGPRPAWHSRCHSSYV